MNQKYTCIIVDDEPLGIAIIEEYLEADSEIEVISTCHNGFEGLKQIQLLKPDLVFLDVQMPRLTGIELLELLTEPPHIIFVTAYEQYAIKAFEANAIDYLLKPFTQDRFQKAVNKFKAAILTNSNSIPSELPLQSEESKERIVVKNGNSIQVIPFADVLYLEAYDDYVKIYTAGGMFLKTKTLSHFEQVLPSTDFVRIHRSFLVAIAQIQKIEPYQKNSWQVVLLSGKKLSVSASGYTRLRSVMNW